MSTSRTLALFPVFCRYVLAEGRKANIVNIGSVQAAKILPGRTHYAPAKLAIEARRGTLQPK